MRKMKILQTHQSETEIKISFKIFRTKQSKQKKTHFEIVVNLLFFSEFIFFFVCESIYFPQDFECFSAKYLKNEYCVDKEHKSHPHLHLYQENYQLEFLLSLRNSFLNYKLIGSWVW